MSTIVLMYPTSSPRLFVRLIDLSDMQKEKTGPGSRFANISRNILEIYLFFSQNNVGPRLNSLMNRVNLNRLF